MSRLADVARYRDWRIAPGLRLQAQAVTAIVRERVAFSAAHDDMQGIHMRHCVLLLPLVLLAASPSRGQGGSPVVLQPSRTFELSTDPSLRIRQFAARSDGLYFLQSGRDRAEILKTDFAGRTVQRTAITHAIHHMYIDRSGRVVLIRNRPRQTMLSWLEPGAAASPPATLRRLAWWCAPKPRWCSARSSRRTPIT